MFNFFFADDYEKSKKNYTRKKMEQIQDIDELERNFQYYQQFFEPFSNIIMNMFLLMAMSNI
jgi:hypothetical protein